MTWRSDNTQYVSNDRWLSTAYAGFGILFEELPTTGENGGSPLLDDGGVPGDEIRWILLNTTGDLVINEFSERGVFASTNTGTAEYRSFINNVAVVPDFTITVNPIGLPDEVQSGGILSALGYIVANTTPADTVEVQTDLVQTSVATILAFNNYTDEVVINSGLTIEGVALIISDSTFIDNVTIDSNVVILSNANIVANTDWVETADLSDITYSGLTLISNVSINAETIATDTVVKQSGLTIQTTAYINAVNIILTTTVKQTGSTITLNAAILANSLWEETSPILDIVESGGILTLHASIYASNSFVELSSEWSLPTTLFTEPEEIKEISLTFDQLGRPLVFYRIETDTLKLYWYDPVIQETVNVQIAYGTSPNAGFDFPQDTGQSFTDILLFYVRSNKIYMRVQRDRFNVEYECPVEADGLVITSSGLRVDNRYQVVYKYKDLIYTPPVVIPTPLPPINEIFNGVYLNTNNGCYITNYMVNVVEDSFKFGFKISDSYFPRYTETGVNAFKQLQYMFGTDDRKQFFCAISRDTRNNQALINMWRGYSEYNATFNLNDFDGDWEFEFFGLNRQVIIKKDNLVIFNGNLATPNMLKSKLNNLHLAGSKMGVLNTGAYSYYGCVYNCWIEKSAEYVEWPVQTINSSTQPPIEPGPDLTIFNHKIQNWILTEQ